jgi:starvation-inducible DNA-binding protein
LRNSHWNVTGPHFMALHEFFQKQYEQIDEFIDAIAERIRSIGHYSAGSLTDFLKMTHLSETKNEDPSAENMLSELMQDHEIIIRWLRTQVPTINDKHNDMGTADFLTGLMEEHEKMAWMIRAHLG